MKVSSCCRQMCLHLRSDKAFTNSSLLQSPPQYHRWKVVCDLPKYCVTQCRLPDSTFLTSCLIVQKRNIGKLSKIHHKNLSSQLSYHTCCRSGMKKSSEMMFNKQVSNKENGQENCNVRQEIALQKFAAGNIKHKWSDAHRNRVTGNLYARSCVSRFGNYCILSSSQSVNRYSSPHQARSHSNWQMQQNQISHNSISSHGGYYHPYSIPSRTITTSCPHLMELKSMDDFKGPTLSQMTTYLKKNKLSCQMGYTCLVLECAFCEGVKSEPKLSSAKSAVGKRLKESISERNLYINMTTGRLYSTLI